MNAQKKHDLIYITIIITSRHIQFGVMSPQNMVKIGELEVTQRDLYMPESRTPVKGGVLDLRMVIKIKIRKSNILLLFRTNGRIFIDRSMGN